ncbi:PREDICTED: leptin receptor isoform X2 [Corvus brachyrhynchos]|nr:PREDICTED: leptin receptor isoform X2 [Corvus brachyrhynchos]XP_017596290.1 PREDICTED: leptin receptor isoform X2 [Corvus brachyrhynchos]
MCGQIIPTMFVLMDFLQMAAAHCMVHPVPPRNFTLPCVLLNETFLSPFSAGSWSGLRRELGTPKTKSLMNEESFLCCLWSASNIGCSLYRASMQARKFIPSEINISAHQQIDWSWNVECRIRGKLDLLVCNLQLLKLDLRDDLKVNLLYSGSELSQGAASTSSLQGTVRVARCDCREQDTCECPVASPSLNHTYLLWLEVVAGGTALGSPPMSLQPTDIVKPEAPVNLQLELAERGQVKLCWSSPVLLPFPLQHQVRISAPPGHGECQMLQVALETSVAIDSALLDSPSSVQVRSRNLRGPGFWSDWSTPYNPTLGAQVLYFPPKTLTSAGSNISFLCIYKNKSKPVEAQEVVWWLNLAEEIPASQYSLVNNRVSKVTLFNLKATKPRGSFFYNALYCCHQSRECHHRYAELYVVDMDFNISCETDGYLTKMTCRWSANPTTLLLGSLQLRYYRSQIYCSDFPSPSPNSEVKECHLQRNHSYECTFQPIFLLSGYTMWIEFEHFLGTLESSPTCVIPADVVKPLPPSNVGAELTRNVGLLNVSWTKPVFANRDLTFQIRWNAGNREGIPWQLYEVPNSTGSSAVIKVEQLCVEYVVQVRCRELDGSGFWSDWSRAAQTLVQDIRAPLHGPEFWRIISEDPARKQRNVTLVWKPLMENHSLCSVSRYIIKHQIPGNPSWEEYVDHGTTWSFPWIEPTHTITILAMNSVGISAVNSNLTLSQQMSTVDAVQSLSAYLVNSTCVVVVWTLSPHIPEVTSFVIEWKNLNKEEEMKWLRVPPNLRKYFIYDHFILIEKYQFSLYPVFAGGVGKARATDQFAKGGFETGNNGSLHVVLPIVFSTSVLLLGALLVSHPRMKKLFWEDVPNPKNCSWAQGVNFQQPEALENLFAKHPEPMSFEPLLLEAEIVLEDISVTKALEKEEPRDFLGIDSMFPTPQESECDSACSSSHFQGSSFSRSSQDGETTAQCDLKYATVISDSQSSGLCRQKTNPRSCFDECFLAEDSVVFRAFSSGAWEVGSGALVAFPGSPGWQPSRALSLTSSEGFSEPLDDAFPGSAERSLYYLGITSLQKGERDIFLTESSRGMCQLQSTDLLTDGAVLQHIPANVKEFIHSSLKPKATVPYVPQFRMAASKGQEATEKK